MQLQRAAVPFIRNIWSPIDDWIIDTNNSTSTYYVVVGYKGKDTEITIPSSINNRSIYLSYEGISFLNSSNSASTGNAVTNVIVTDGIKGYSSGIDNSFANMFKDTSILEVPNIPSNITNTYQTFMNCKSLSGSIPVLPDTITNMFSMFEECTGITNMVSAFPKNATSIGWAFYNCSSITGTIPEFPQNLTSMLSAFVECQRLTGPIPTIPDTVTIMHQAFFNCKNLTGSIPKLPESATRISNAFHNCAGLTDLSLPNFPNNVTNAYRCFYLLDTYGNCYVHSTEIINVKHCFRGSSAKNIYIHYTYENGTYTKTYNSFLAANYFNGINGVTMYNF